MNTVLLLFVSNVIRKHNAIMIRVHEKNRRVKTVNILNERN